MARQKYNHDAGMKLKVRRRVIGESGDALSVIDCCHGPGAIWNQLRREYVVDRFVAIDKKPVTAGAIKADAEKLLPSLDLSQYNVIDCDTFGSPWAILLAASPKIRLGTYVFGTWGVRVVRGGTSVCKTVSALLGIDGENPAFTQYYLRESVGLTSHLLKTMGVSKMAYFLRRGPGATTCLYFGGQKDEPHHEG